VKTEAKKVVEYLSFLLICCYQFAGLAHERGYAFFDLLFLADIPVEALLVIISSYNKFCAIPKSSSPASHNVSHTPRQ